MAVFCECLRKNGHDNSVFFPENHQQKSPVLCRRFDKKKIIKITLFSFLLGRGGGHFDKNGGGGGVILTNTHIFYQKVIRSEF